MTAWPPPEVSTTLSSRIIEELSALLRGFGPQKAPISPGSVWESGYVESLIGKMRDELCNREIFYTLDEARVLIEQWRGEYNQVRPHSSLGYRPPAPEAIEWPLGTTRRPTTVMDGFPT